MNKEYGYSKSVMEAVEELGVACMVNGMQPPKVITFDKESLAKLTATYKAKERIKFATEEENNARVNSITTSAGVIKIEEEKDEQ